MSDQFDAEEWLRMHTAQDTGPDLASIKAEVESGEQFAPDATLEAMLPPMPTDPIVASILAELDGGVIGLSACAVPPANLQSPLDEKIARFLGVSPRTVVARGGDDTIRTSWAGPIDGAEPMPLAATFCIV